MTDREKMRLVIDEAKDRLVKSVELDEVLEWVFHRAWSMAESRTTANLTRRETPQNTEILN